MRLPTNIEHGYLDLLHDILHLGEDRSDRTGVGTRSIFSTQLEHDLSEGFPLLTTKKVAWKAMVTELLWFIEGSGDERRLRELLHGDRASEKGTIWTANAEADYWKPKAEFDGDLGRIYGVQWRRWRTFTPVSGFGSDQQLYERDHPVDQLANLVNGLIKDPFGRRHVLTAWNPGELAQMALPPCHMFAQFHVGAGHELHCKMYQRSADIFLGTPFNIASYALLTHLLAHVTNLKAGRLVIDMGDTHIYHNHFEAVKEQLGRDPLNLPTISINPNVKSIDAFVFDDIALWDYQHHPAIKAPMAV